MPFLQVLKKVFTTPVYLFNDDKELTKEEEQKEEEALFAADEQGNLHWYDKVFSWPLFIITWLVDLAIKIFWRQGQVELGQRIKPRKLKTASVPLLSFLYFILKVLLVAIVMIAVIILTGWIVIKVTKF